MSKYEEIDVLRASAKAHSIPGKEIVRLSKHPNHFIRWIIAYYELTPSWILAEMANDPHWTVRYEVACNPNTEKAVVKYRLALDTDKRVRKSAEMNPIIDETDRIDIQKMRGKQVHEA